MPTRTADRTTLGAYTAVAEAWNSAGVRYAVMRGFEGYPNRPGRDLDVLVEPSDALRALRIAAFVLKSHGHGVLFPPSVWVHRLVAYPKRGCSTALTVDVLAGGLQWRGVPLAVSPQPFESIGALRVDPWAAWAKSVLMRFLAGDVETAARRHAWFEFQTEWIPRIRENLRTLLGLGLAHALWDQLATSELMPLRRLRPRVARTMLVRAAARDPLGLAVGHLLALCRRALVVVHHSAPVVALVGPDGVGKTTVAGLLHEGESPIFTGIALRHWRPGILPTLGRLAGRAGQHPTPCGLLPPRRSAGRAEAFRALYYGLDYWLGCWLRDRVDTGRQRLVVYDRHALDMVVDPARYGMRSGRAARSMVRLVPRPDLIIALTADPRIVVERKPELSVEEVANQNAAWLELYRQGQVDAVVDASRLPTEVAEDLRRLIMAKFIAMHSPKRGA